MFQLDAVHFFIGISFSPRRGLSSSRRPRHESCVISARVTDHCCSLTPFPSVKFELTYAPIAIFIMQFKIRLHADTDVTMKLMYCIVNRLPDPDPRGSCTGSRYDWLTCGTPTGLRNQNGVDVQAISNLAIGFPLLLEL